MLAKLGGVFRHPKFSDSVDALSGKFDRVHEVVEGAIWEIKQAPERFGVYLEELDVWQARLVSPPILIFYCFNARYVTMLTVISADDAESE